MTGFTFSSPLRRFGCAALLAGCLLLGAPAMHAAQTAPALMPDEQQTIRIYKDASPAVVNITSTTLNIDFFFNITPQQGTGSGVILTPDGYILTNAHVVQDKDRLEVTLTTGKTYKARLIGGDLSKDIALIKVDPDAGEKLPTIELGDSDHLQVGQHVYAIGNPFGLNGTLTSGVISSLGRTLKAKNGRIIENVIQSDTAINPGNSGGALLDSRGKLIGINTAIFSPSGTSAGISFAIPVSMARRIATDLIEHGKVVRAYLGMQPGLEVNPAIAQALHLPVDAGLMVQNIVPASPADKAGLHGASQQVMIGNRPLFLGGDIIVKADNVPITEINHFVNYVESKRPGDRMTLEVYRDGQKLTLPVTLEERAATEDIGAEAIPPS
ncbi:MAG: S1C family serine protease [Candidatus Melainabacteria bacterium]